MATVLLLISSALGSIAGLTALALEAGWLVAAATWLATGFTGFLLATSCAFRQS